MEQRDSLRSRRACPGLPPGGEPIVDRLLNQTGFSAVMGEQRGLSSSNLRKPVFEGGGDACMKVLTTAAQQSAVGGILNQRVLKPVFSVRWCAAPVNQLCIHQLSDGVI